MNSTMITPRCNDSMDCSSPRQTSSVTDTFTYSVLHLDDDPQYLSLSKDLLERFGDINVETSECPFQALERVESGSYDAIITDLNMPKLSGFEFIKAIRSAHDQTPIIILSSDSEPATIIKYVNIFYFSKNVSPDLISDQIRRLILFFGSEMLSRARYQGYLHHGQVKRETKVGSLIDNMNIHDIRNQLNIQGNILEFLMQKYQEEEDLSLYLPKVLKATERIHTIIDSTRSSMKYRNIGSQWLDIQEIFQPAATIADREGIVSSVDDNNVELLADPYLDRIFLILVENSIMHGGRVTTIRVSADHLGDDLLLTYEDDGQGISPEEKEKVFIRGFGKNTGQGLYFVRSLLTLTGITIRETGRYGRGVRFVMKVPANQFRNSA